MIVLVSGRKRSGKDTVANYIVSNYKGFYRDAFAKPMKDMARLLFGWGDEWVEGQYKETVDSRFGFSPRQFLQWIGTEVFQYHMCEKFPDFDKLVNRNFWVMSLVRRYESQSVENVAISDLRFPHEIEYVKTLYPNSLILSVERESVSKVDTHESEIHIDNLPRDYTIKNNASLDTLFEIVDNIMAKENFKKKELL